MQFYIFVVGSTTDSGRESNLTGDAEGSLQGTKIIKNIPTFKVEHWNIVELKASERDFPTFV